MRRPRQRAIWSPTSSVVRSATPAGGTFGLIATNTIAQGDTRAGLRWICTHGGTIYAARSDFKWPGPQRSCQRGSHRKGAMPGPFELDGRPAERVTAYLFQRGDTMIRSLLNGLCREEA